MRGWRLVIGAVALVLGGCGVAPVPSAAGPSGPMPTASASKPAPAPSVELAPAVTVDHPLVSVTPAQGLTDSETVEVRVTGFGVGGKVFLSECASAAAVNPIGCGAQLAAQTFLVTDDSRAGSGSFVIHVRAATKGLDGSSLVTCTSQCVIVATIGAIAEDNGQTYYGFASAPISFATR